MTEDDLKKIEGMLSFHFGNMSADFQGKIDLVVEGQQMLAERMDRMEERLVRRTDQVEKRLEMVEANLTRKIDAVSADLTGHRADTEAHRKGWRVREE